MSNRPISVAVHPNLEESLSASWLAEIADSALSALAMPVAATVEVVVTDDETVRELNLRHRGLDETTDVLSFATETTASQDDDGFVLPPEADVPTSIGEVVISGPQSSKQAAERGRDTADEVAFLLAHGILHLMGHDHEESAERQEMESEHRRLLTAMLGSRASEIEVEYPV